MTSIDDSTQTPPGYWFGVIEGRLHQRMRDTLADLGLRRGGWRILHTLADGPATADELAERGVLRGSHLLPSVRGELLAQLGRTEEAVSELTAAARLAGNERERGVLLAKAARLRQG